MTRHRGKHRFTGSLAESYCCPTSANRPPRWVATRTSCVGPVLSVPDSSAPSPPGPSGSGLFAEGVNPDTGPTKVGPFSFVVAAPATNDFSYPSRPRRTRALTCPSGKFNRRSAQQRSPDGAKRNPGITRAEPSRIARSLSSGAHSRDPLAPSGLVWGCGCQGE
jgi:hypothetical protein